MKKKYNYILIAILIIVLIAVIFFIAKGDSNKNKPNNSENNSIDNVSRLATESNMSNNADNSSENTDNTKLNEVNNRMENVLSNITSENKTNEEELSSYSTKLGSSTEGRLTNIRITCGKLNGTTVSDGETFSFCDTTGPSKEEEGYKKATVFLNGEEIQALGGGNCQVSSTLYNAVLAVSDLKVVERHEHGKRVHYVPEGKDAAVSYGSVDFKFKNNTGNSLKLYFDTDDVTLTVRIVKLV